MLTNKEYLFNLDDYDLAEYLVSGLYENESGYEVYIDPSGNEWFIYDDAIEATMEWLNKEVE